MSESRHDVSDERLVTVEELTGDGPTAHPTGQGRAERAGRHRGRHRAGFLARRRRGRSAA